MHRKPNPLRKRNHSSTPPSEYWQEGEPSPRSLPFSQRNRAPESSLSRPSSGIFRRFFQPPKPRITLATLLRGQRSPSYINRNGAVSVPADKLVSLLSSHELLALRATCREIAGLTAPHVATAFTFLQYTFTAPAALQSLMRIGAWCTSLVITLPNTPGGKITLPLRNEYDKQRVFSVFPTPVDTFWASDRYVQEKHSGIVQTADTQLFQTARDKKAWTMMFASLPALRRLKVETPGLSPGKGLQRTCVDEALMTLREVLERRERGGQIREFVYDGHAGGVWILDPMHSWNGRGVRKAWWAELVEVEMIVSKWSLKGFHSWERGTVERAWRGFAGMSTGG